MRKHQITTYKPTYHPAYLANGLVGLRVGKIPLLNGSAVINGYNGYNEQQGVEGYAPAPYPVGADIVIDGYALSDREDLAEFLSQTYDFSCGELESRFRFQAGSKKADIETLTFCSRTLPTIALQEIRITVDQPAELKFRAILETFGIAGKLPGRCLQRAVPGDGADGVVHWEAHKGQTSCGAAFAAEFPGDDVVTHRRNDRGYEEGSIFKEFVINAKPGKRYVFRQIGSLVPGIMHEEPHWQAVRMIGVAHSYGFDQLRDENRKAWAELWKARIKLIGADEKWQDIIDAAYFYLHSTIHPSTPCSMAPFGLARWDAFCGHVFWDTESFMFYPVLFTAPDSARAILDYRSRSLPAAKFNAALNGNRGVLFPWESGNYGSEVQPVFCMGGGALAVHVNMDVAFAFAQYVHVTGDTMFLAEQAWPVIKGVAEWIVSRAVKSRRGYEILHVTGIDEGSGNIDNNAYTNITAVVVLQKAVFFAEQLGFSPPEVWRDIAKHMFIPADTNGVILKWDGYEYKEGVCCPDSLAAFFPFDYQTTPEIERATFNYYLDLAHTYIGHPMLSPLLGVFAARLGNRRQAQELFDEAAFPYMDEPFFLFREMNPNMWRSSAPNVPFGTNAAGLLMACIMGLPGMRPDSGNPENWFMFPVTMPENWDGIEIDSLTVRGKQARLDARHGEPAARFEMEFG